MNEKLLIIKEQLEQLTISIDEYLQYMTQEEIIIMPENFNKIKYLGDNIYSASVFDYNNGAIFVLSSTTPYELEHYRKLLSGKLERLILRKRETSKHWDNWISNFILESEVDTKLRDLYKKNSNSNT